MQWITTSAKSEQHWSQSSQTTVITKSTWKKQITPSFFLEPVNNEETIKEIAKLNNKKSAGDDNIKPKVLKENKETLAKPITHIINLSFKNGESSQ